MQVCLIVLTLLDSPSFTPSHTSIDRDSIVSIVEKWDSQDRWNCLYLNNGQQICVKESQSEIKEKIRDCKPEKHIY